MTRYTHYSFTKDVLLLEIYNYCKQRHKNWFYKDSFVVHLWNRYKWSITLERIFVDLRKLARKGFLAKAYSRSRRDPRVRIVIYYARMDRIEEYLRQKGLIKSFGVR